MSSPLKDLTPTELQTLKEFRKNVDDILQPKHDDAFLLRWLRARNFKLSDAETMLRKSFEWRTKYKVDNILQNFVIPEVVQKYWSLGCLGYDKEGCPVWLTRFGNIDIKGIIYSAKKSDVTTFYTYLLESSESKMREQTKKLGKLIDRHIYIFDLENFILQQIIWKPAFDLITTILRSYEDNYPERLKLVLLINAPAIFQIAFALIKPVLSEETVKKIHIMGRENWKEILFQEVDASVIPLHWGGTRIGPNGDPFCSNLVSPGGTVPTSYYLQESQNLSNEDDVHVLEVGLKSVATLEVFVPEGDSVLQWEFKTEKHDIGFGLYFKTDEYNNKDLKELIPVSRVNCHLVPETGDFVCEEEGTYVLKFDNTFSLLTSKTIRCRTEIIPPTTKL